MIELLRKIWRLTRIAVSGRESLVDLSFLVIVIGLELASIWVSLQFIAWNAKFFDALEKFDIDEALYQTAFYFTLIAVSALRFLISDYLRKQIRMNWRSRLTDHALEKWLANKSYWKLRAGLSPVALENPDQRIAEDCRLFVSGLLNESLDLFTRIVGIFSYVAVLWSLTSFALQFTMFGIQFSITHYLVWFSFIYVILSSLLTHFLGWPLKNLLFDQERKEAEFRYALVRLRENATEIAMSAGESVERERLNHRFSDIIKNWRKLIGREFIVGLFTRPYFQTVLRIPLFLSLPAYLAKEVTLGGLMQLASAFSNVTTTLSWFIFSYRDLADFVATTERLDGLLQDLEQQTLFEDIPANIVRKSIGRDVKTESLNLYTPDGRHLLKIPGFEVFSGERIWIHAPSGTGKTTFLRTLAGIWPYGEGKLSVPEKPGFYGSSAPYLVQEGLGPSIQYPALADPAQKSCLEDILDKVGLGNRIDSLECDGLDALEGMSSGERQRLIIARILFAKPDFVVLDEVVSSLNESAAREMYQLIVEELPDSTIICVAHSRPDGLAIHREIALEAYKASQG